jgi:Tol biopolymer transport system component
MEANPSTGWDVWTRSPEGKVAAFLATPFNETGAAFSGDGRFLAYASDESGRNEVYVQPFPGPGERVMVSTEGGTTPKWSRDGKEIFYLQSDAMMAVEVRTDPAFSAGRPRRLFGGSFRPGYANSHSFDASPDGRRFLMVRLDPGSIPRQINIVLNWFEELKRLVPGGKR